MSLLLFIAALGQAPLPAPVAVPHFNEVVLRNMRKRNREAQGRYALDPADVVIERALRHRRPH